MLLKWGDPPVCEGRISGSVGGNEENDNLLTSVMGEIQQKYIV
jgi:hypothetical protein